MSARRRCASRRRPRSAPASVAEAAEGDQPESSDADDSAGDADADDAEQPAEQAAEDDADADAEQRAEDAEQPAGA